MKLEKITSNKFRFKKWFQWLFNDKWEVFESEMKRLQFEHYVNHRYELERGEAAIKKLREMCHLEPVFRNGGWSIDSIQQSEKNH